MSNLQPEVGKPLILELDGIIAQLTDGAIINAGGTNNPTFTVNGRGLLFDDGSSTAPGGGTVGLPTLQVVYDNQAPSEDGLANIQMVDGKGFAVTSSSGKSLSIDATTGKVTITGDLLIEGSSTVIDTIVQDSDHWLISPMSGTTTALKIEPDIGVTPVVDLVTIRRTFGGSPVFTITSSGDTNINGNLSVTGLINGIDLDQFYQDFSDHEAGVIGHRHMANAVDISPIATIPTAATVQDALVQINQKVDNAVSTTGDCRGFQYVQSTASVMWVVPHYLHSMRVQVAIYDENLELVIPEKVKIIDTNTLAITFLAPVFGSATVIAF